MAKSCRCACRFGDGLMTMGVKMYFVSNDISDVWVRLCGVLSDDDRNVAGPVPLPRGLRHER